MVDDAMRKICTGPMQFTPYRPWSDERKAAARARIAAMDNRFREPSKAELREMLAEAMRNTGAKKARSSTAELAAHNGEVAGSTPAGPTIIMPEPVPVAAPCVAAPPPQDCVRTEPPQLNEAYRPAVIEYIASLGRQMGSSSVITEIDRALVSLAQFRDFAASLHGISKPAPWRRNLR